MHFNEVAQKTVVEEVRAGRQLFKEGDRDDQSVYLLQGEISLVTGNEVVGSVIAGSDAARHPLAHQQPRQVTARAKTTVLVARVDSSLLDIMLTWDQSSGYEVSEIDDNQDDDWMTRILQSQAFLKLPPSNIQRLLMKVESVPVTAGEVIIRQGGEGDYFYIIKNGRCSVSRKPSANAKEVKLAELADGDAFGEDALVSDAKRNASVTMLTDGVLMRLSKQDFVELLKEPLLNKLNYPEAVAKVAKGAVWLDVRLPGEYENRHIPDSRNIPLSALRLEANGLDAARKYIVCCDTGRRSASAAFVLSQRGFEVYVLNDGLGGVPAGVLEGDAAGGADAVSAEAAPPALAEPPAPAVPDHGQAAAQQDRLTELQQENTSLDAAQSQLAGQVNALQEELERVREEAREQILELEQMLADAREGAASARAALQSLETAQGNQGQADAELREQLRALEAELAQRQAQEDRFTAEQATLKARLAELESLQQAHLRQQSEIETLRGRVQQAEAQQAQLAELQAANEQAGQARAQQQRRVDELEAALETATTALAQARAQAEQQHAAQNAAHTGQLQDLQGRVDALETARAEAEARLEAASEALRQAQQSGQDGHVELQAKIETLTGERDHAVAQGAAAQARAEATAQELAASTLALEQARAEAASETARLHAELAEAAAAQTGLAAEHDAALARHEQAAQAHAEVQAALATAQGRIETLQAAAGDQVKQLETDLDEARRQQTSAQAEIDALRQAQADTERGHRERLTELEQACQRYEALDTQAGAQVAQLQAALASADQAQAAVQADCERLQAEQVALQAALSEAEARSVASGQSVTQELEAHQAEAIGLRERLATADQAQAALERERDAAESERDALRARMQQLEQQQTDAAAGQDEQTRLLTEWRDRAQAAERQIEADAAALAAAQQAHQQALAEAEQRLRTDLEKQQRELVAELEGARAALAREQSQRGNYEQAAKSDFVELQDKLAAELARARAEQAALQQELAETASARQTLEAELARTRDDAAAQQQALTAEFEQLRMATSADLEATQKQLRQITDELQAARKRSAGGSADEELARLRLLLDEAREEARSARADAEQWREHALTGPQDTAVVQTTQAGDELAALQVQLADLQSRFDEATQLRDSAQQEAAQLRQSAQAQQLRGAFAVADAAANPAPEARRGGVWAGLAAGLILGVVGAGAALWYGRGDLAAPPPVATATPSHAAPAPRPEAPRVASPVAPVVAQVPIKNDAPATPDAAPPRSLRDTLRDGSPGPRLLEIDAAVFSMGSSSSSLDLDERPRREVQLRRFAIGQYEVSFDEFDAFARATGRALPDDKGWGRGQRPVINVSWEEAVAYTQWLAEQTGQRYRLPSEAEWEYVAGSNARTLYWWGNSTGTGRANCFNCGSEWDARTTTAVGSFAPNALGLYDTAGNVAEWVQDCYQPNYEGAPSDGSARITVGCTRRAVRGGGFNSPASNLRITKRDQQLASTRADDLGFRVAREF
ncbi:MAG: SUMF1/EgtB/PvdO family nonheme iron enzyme [Gammaproteobacteria bacterium]